MRSPDIILETIRGHAKDPDYKYERLYRLLYNEDFYLLALQNIYSNKGAMTPGIDGLTLDGYGSERIDKIIKALKDHSYQPNPVRRQYIKKKNGKLRPLGISSSDDKLVQEIIKMILESIYDPTFSIYSHGFRPNLSCHTALKQVQHNFTGIKWFVEGDIKSYFDTIDHHILIKILRRRIYDESFIELIWKFLRAGYMENWNYNETYSGIAQGSGFSPVLANIYLNEFDKFIENYKTKFDTGEKRRPYDAHRIAQNKFAQHCKKMNKRWGKYTEEEKQEALTIKAQLKKEHQKYPLGDPQDEGYKRLQYVRYADDFIIGIIGSKEDAMRVKRDIAEYFAQVLRLELSEEKTLVTNCKDKARFLGYDICITHDSAVKRTKSGRCKHKVTMRVYSERVRLYVPKDKWVGKLLGYGVLGIKKDRNQNEVWKPLERKEYIYLAPQEIVRKYNAQIRGIYNYYKLASNVSVLNKFYYIMEYSMYKTFAAKYRITMTKAKLKYTKNKEFVVPYESKKGTKYEVFYNDGFRKDTRGMGAYVDVLPEYSDKYKPKELYFRYKKKICEMCGKNNSAVKIFQVKSLKDLSTQTIWGKIMLKRNRKTLVVCEDCYQQIHV